MQTTTAPTATPTGAPAAGRAAAVLVAGIAAFQAALAAGAPWGRVAWGGGHSGTLPAHLRVASAVAAGVWLAVAAALASGRLRPAGRRRLATALVVVSVLAVVANAASRSAPERTLWTPYALVLLGCAWAHRRAVRPAGEPVSSPRRGSPAPGSPPSAPSR